MGKVTEKRKTHRTAIKQKTPRSINEEGKDGIRKKNINTYTNVNMELFYDLAG